MDVRTNHRLRNISATWVLVCFVVGSLSDLAPADPIPVATLKKEVVVGFQKDILPILRKNCLACHNASDKEGGLILENPAAMIKGGDSGPAITAGKADESLLFTLARHADDPAMPPEDNDVGAKPLTSDELAKFKRWIDSGAKYDSKAAAALVWQPLPPGVNPIYALDLSSDGRFLAAGRANQITVYHVPSQREIGKLTDPDLLKIGIYQNPGVAHLDLVQSLAFHPSDTMVASGGYRTVKLWQRPARPITRTLGNTGATITRFVTHVESKQLATIHNNGSISVFSGDQEKPTAHWKAAEGVIHSANWNLAGNQLATADAVGNIVIWDAAGKQLANFKPAKPALDLVWLTETSVALACDDGFARTWDFAIPPMPKEPEKKPEPKPNPDEAPANEEPAKPPVPIWHQTLELKIGGTPIRALARIPGQPKQLAFAGDDGQLRIWDLATKRQIRSMAHGQPIAAISIRGDGKQFVSVSASHTGKLWDAAGKLLGEFKGDIEHNRELAHAEFGTKLDELRVTGGKADVEAAKKRKTSEEANQKKTAEELKKAEEDLKKKQEATKKPKADSEIANKLAATSKQQLAEAETAAKKAVTNETSAKQKRDQQIKAEQQATKALQTAKQAETKATANQQKADAAAKAKPEDAKLIEAAKAAATASQATKAAREKATADLTSAQQTKKQTEEDFKKKTADKKAADTKKTQLTQQLKKQTDNAKKLTDASKKADTEMTQAQSVKDSAVKTVARAKQLVEQSGKSVTETEKTLTTLEAAHKTTTESLTTLKKTVVDREPALISVAFSPGGEYFATGTKNGRLFVWNGKDASAVERFTIEPVGVVQCEFVSDTTLISNSGDGRILHWQILAPWQLTRTIGNADKPDLLRDRVTAVAFSPDGKLLATGSGEPSRDGQLKIWDVATGKLVREITDAHSDMVLDLAFSREGNRLASSAADRFIKVWDVGSGKHQRSFEGHSGHVLGISWSADSRLLASVGSDQVSKIWDARAGDQKRTITGFKKEVTDTHFVGLTTNLLVIAADPIVQFRRTDNGGNLRSFSGATDYLYASAVSANGKLLAAGGHASTVRIWQDDGKLLVAFE